MTASTRSSEVTETKEGMAPTSSQEEPKEEPNEGEEEPEPQPPPKHDGHDEESTITRTTTATATTAAPQKEFLVGDHVFCWCSYKGLPYAYQQHGIVVEVNTNKEEEEEEEVMITIINFDYEEPEDETSARSENDKEEGSLVVKDQDKDVANAETMESIQTKKEEEKEEEETKEIHLMIQEDYEEEKKETEAESEHPTPAAKDKKEGEQSEQTGREEQGSQEINKEEDGDQNNTKEQENSTILVVDPLSNNNTQQQQPTIVASPRFPFWKTKPGPNAEKDRDGNHKEQENEQPPPVPQQQRRSMASFFQTRSTSNVSDQPQVDKQNATEVVSNEDNTTDKGQSETENNGLRKSFANFFQRKSSSNEKDTNPQLQQRDQHDGEDLTAEEKQHQFQQRSDSTLSALFASEPDRPCTLKRQILSQQEAQDKWEHVRYGEQWHKRLVSRAGTCSPLQPHPLPVTLMRIHFLQQPHGAQLLEDIPYHHQTSNGECMACWCKTGQYRSFAGTAKLGKPGLHAATFGMAAEWGAIWGGQIATAILFPPAIPFLAAYDVYDVYHYGHTFHKAHHVDREWQERTNAWNEAFSNYVQEQDAVEMVLLQEKLLAAHQTNNDAPDEKKDEVGTAGNEAAGRKEGVPSSAVGAPSLSVEG